MAATIQLCGRLAAHLDGRELVPPGRQGRAVFAYLVLNRARLVAREELRELLWAEEPPRDPGETLSALLSRVRRALGPGVLDGRRELALDLPVQTEIDWEVAGAAAVRAETALADRDWRTAWDAAATAAAIASRGFLIGDELPWIDARRADLEAVRLAALEARATAGVELGGAELAAGERAARALVEAAPFRESGHRLLMAALAARGEVAEALRVYDGLRLFLREELGTAPGAAVQELHRRLLEGGSRRAEPAPPADERKLVSVVCAELEPASEPADPEQLRAARAAAHGRLRAVVERYGGTAHELREGPAVALFGVPTAHEDDAARAVRAARDACEGGLVRRAAVAFGEAVVEGATLVATGRVLGRAHELLGSARAGEVAVDESAAGATRPPARRSRLIGRRSELAALTALYRGLAEEARPRFVLVLGDAGVGKSRLVEELLTRAERDGATVLRGRCPALVEGSGHWALRELLWEAAGITLDDGGPVAARKLEVLASACGLDEPTVSALAVSAGIALPGDRGESTPEESALAWPAFLSALARNGPLVVAIEDLHWAEPPLLEMLKRIHGGAAGPVLLATTARPEFLEAHGEWSRRSRLSQIALEPLARRDARALVDELLPAADAALRDRVVDLAEGNPFFMEELARHVDVDGGDLPDTVRAVLAARIDALPAAEKSVLQHAAVVGRRFWAPALEPNRTGRPLPELLRLLEDRGLIVARATSSLPGQRELWFAHGLTREVAYRSIPRGARARTHADVAAWLEQLARDRRLEFIDLLAHHYEAAAAPDAAALAWPDGSPEPERLRAAAVRALLEAGGAARMGILPELQTGRHARRALALARTDRERLAATELLARSFHAAVRSDEALAAYLDAIELARTLGDSAEVARLRAHAVLLCTRYMGGFSDDTWMATARTLVDEGLAELDEIAGSFEAGALLLASGSGRWRWGDAADRDPSQARRDVERALEIADAIGSDYLRAYALEALTWRVFEQGLCEAEAMGERLMTGADSLTNRVEAHESLCVAAICFARAARFERASEIAARASRQAGRLSPHRRLHAAASEAIALIPPGRFPALLAATERILELAEEEGPRICATGLVALAGRALALYEARREAEARRLLPLVMSRMSAAVELRTYGHPIAEMLRPVLGAAGTTRLLRAPDPREHAGTAVSRLRVQLPLAATEGTEEQLERAVTEARALAGAACAPALACIADWADATCAARAGWFADALERGIAAAERLAELGERYTADRLLAELLPQIRGQAAAREADRAASRLAAMGAGASAQLLAA